MSLALETGYEDGEAPSISTAASATDIKSALAQLKEREAAVTARLDELIATQRDLVRTLGRLDLARARLGSHAIAARALGAGMLATASQNARRISSAVHALDREQANVKATLDVVEHVAELKACVLGVHGSMGAPQDWETAANYLWRAGQVPRSVVDGLFAADIVPTTEVPDPPRVTLDHAAESLCALFVREFDRAAAEGDGARVTRFFKLFPLIGRAEVGLDAYGRYVCSGIASRARANMGAAPARTGIFYAQAWTKLLEHIAQIVDGHAALVERHYGEGSMTTVVERIQVEADVQGRLILDSWVEERRVNRTLTDVKAYPFTFLVHSFLPSQRSGLAATPRSSSPAPGASGRASEDETVDMKDIDALLNESATMLSRWSLYSRFLASKTSNHDDERLYTPAFILHSTLQKKVRDNLVDPFNVMATFFLRRSVEKSFQLDEPPADLHLNPNKSLRSGPPFITSAVDDVMYIVSQVLQRALSTAQRSVVGSVIPAVGRVLGGDFFGMVQRKMRDETYPKAAIQGALPPESLIVAFIVLLNNLDVATEYVHRIVRGCLGEPADPSAARIPGNTTAQSPPLIESFPFADDAAFVDKTLRNLTTGFEVKTSELIAEAIEVLLKQVVRPRLRPILIDTFRDVDYDLSSSAAHGAEDPTVLSDPEDADDAARDGDAVAPAARFARGWRALIRPLNRLLTPSNADRLARATLPSLARMLEKRILSLSPGRVSALGTVRLERDMSGIIAAAVEGGKYEWRNEFERVREMCVIVGMEDEEWEAVERGLEGGKWVLDAEERKAAREMLRR